MKNYLTITEQINGLSHKNVTIDDQSMLSTYLKKNSYYTFVGGTKMYFIQNIVSGKKVYVPSSSSEWILKFENMKTQAINILKLLLDFEMMVVTEFIDVVCKKQMRGEDISNLMTDCLIEINKWRKNDILISQLEEEPWRYLNDMTFGSLIYIIRKYDCGSQRKITQYMSKTVTLNNLGTCRILRNGISHNTPLSILFNDRRDFQKRKNFILELYRLNNIDDSDVIEIIDTAERYNKITKK